MVNDERMEAQLVLHEGLRTRPYQDTRGNWTIGVGYNLTARGSSFMKVVLNKSFNWPDMYLSREDALTVLRADIHRVEGEILASWPHYVLLSEIRQRVILDMCYNLGHRAGTFIEAKAALERGDYAEAAAQMTRSAWAGQVGERATRLETMMLTNEDYTA